MIKKTMHVQWILCILIGMNILFHYVKNYQVLRSSGLIPLKSCHAFPKLNNLPVDVSKTAGPSCSKRR